jgi:Oxidoreductase family, NAD-binding Rossmann fold
VDVPVSNFLRFDVVGSEQRAGEHRGVVPGSDLRFIRSHGARRGRSSRRYRLRDRATPNNLHFPVANAFLDAGIHVMCDKPLTFTLAEAE